MVNLYLHRVAEITKRGDAREESYYRPLADFLEEFSSEKRKKKVYVTSLPKKTEAGNPDFRVWDGKHSIVGYIEAKQPNANLDDVEDTKQLERYIGTFPNLILTNFYEFRLYRHGQRIASVLLARPFIPAKLKTVPPAEHEPEFIGLLDKFFEFSRPKKFTAETLAKELATLTRFLRDEVIAEQLAEEHSKGSGTLLGFYEAFRQHLIADLTHETFADLYAQTLTYGLFAARTRSENGFNRKLAYDLIPKTIGILRDIFRFISLEEPPPQLEWVVDDIAEVLAAADVTNILHTFFKEGKGADPVFHFYETFLAHYNPEERERRGVYYTPEPVVSYIVRSLNILLKEKFGRADGFATPSVTVLDPAGGTLTFIAEAARVAMAEFEKYGKGSRSKFVEDHILKNFYSFELMMAPYAAGHLKMGFLLEELGHKLTGEERFQFFLTNTLEMEELAQTTLPGMASLSEESHLAGKVKKEKPILVILGNPPYSVSSANKSDFIEKEMSLYKNGVRAERNIQPLSDDYIKFIRFAHWKIERAGAGAIGFITNNSYLSGLIHRGMREELLRTFDALYVLNLHGNARLREKTPRGGFDENVFDIMQGVSIAIFVKKSSGTKDGVFYEDAYGTRETKYKYLTSHDIRKTKWKKLRPSSPLFFFVPFDTRASRSYQSYPSIKDIFGKFSEGVKTHRDEFVVGFSSKEVEQRVRVFAHSFDWKTAAQTFDLSDTRDWKVEEAWRNIRTENWKVEIFPYDYRPFDKRNIIYTPTLVELDRREVMQHLLRGSNVALNVTRRLRDVEWRHALVSSTITDKTILSAKDNCYTLPLHLYPEKEKPKRGRGVTMMLFEPEAHYGSGEKTLNITPKLFGVLESAYKKTATPEEIFNYIYAVLYSNAYRRKYSEFLRTDFPRVPFTSSHKLFSELVKKGEALVALHLLKSKLLAKPIAAFEGDGDNRVEKVTYNPENSRVCINPVQYFTGVKSDVWDYHIGGYQVADKWLKDRKGRALSSEEVMHYCRVITALSETIKIQKSLDELFENVEKSVLDLRAPLTTVNRGPQK